MLLSVPQELPQCSESFNFAYDVVDKWAAQSPSSQAMLWVDQGGKNPLSLDFAHLSCQSNRAAEVLVRLEARGGDWMIIALPRVPAWWAEQYHSYPRWAVFYSRGISCALTIIALWRLYIDRIYRWEIAAATIRIGVVVCPCPVLAIAHDIKYHAKASRASIYLSETLPASLSLRLSNASVSIFEQSFR